MSFFLGRIGSGFDIIRLKPTFLVTLKFARSINHVLRPDSKLYIIPACQRIIEVTSGFEG
jgi:hypothetical protein